MGMGSTAFPKLLGQQSANAKISVALGMLPWGFASSRYGSITLRAWEAVVWGDKTYCVFIMAAPPGTPWSGVAGFIKAVFRWNAPPTQTMEISGIEASAAVDPTVSTAIAAYTGMMNAGARWRSGAVTAKTFVAGELAFVSATTNNQSVLVDFSSWIQGSNGTSLVLGNVDPVNPPPYAEALYMVLENSDGTVSVVLDDAASLSNSMPAGMFNSATDLHRAYEAWQDGVAPKPVPRRCGGALLLKTFFGESVPAGKCDSGLSWASGFCTWGSAPWSDVSGTTAPMNSYMRLGGGYKRALVNNGQCGSMVKVLSETYVHMWSRAYDLPGSCTPESNGSFCARLGLNCGTVSATDNCGNVRSVSSCGSCTAGLTCGGAGQDNICGNPNRVSYEAEAPSNTIAGAAFTSPCVGYIKTPGTQGGDPEDGTCSAGHRVKYVGNGSSNYVRFNYVKAPVSGTYQLTVYSMVLGTRSISVSVNGGSAKTITVTGDDWFSAIGKSINVSLNAGNNTIKIYNNSAYAPDIDRIVVTRL